MMKLRPSYTRLPVTSKTLHYFSNWTIHWCDSRDFLLRLTWNVKIDRTFSVETIRGVNADQRTKNKIIIFK